MNMQSIEIRNLVDELGGINAKLATYDELAKRREEVKKLLAEYCDSLSSAEETLQGGSYTIVFSKPTINRSIEDVGGFLETVGIQSFLGAVKISTTVASKLLSKTDASRLFVETRGSRRLKAIVEVAQVARPSAEQKAVEDFYRSLSGLIGNVTPGFTPGLSL